MLQRKLTLTFSLFFAGLGLFFWGILLPARAESPAASEYLQYLPIANHYYGNPMDQVTLYPPANQYLNFNPYTFVIEYGASLIPETVMSETFVIHASQTGVITGWLYVSDQRISFFRFDGQPFHPGEIIQATVTTGVGAAPIEPLHVIHPSIPSVWQYPIPATGGSGMMEPGNSPALGSGEGTSLAVGDLNGDRNGDVLVAYMDHAEVWLNDGAGSFSMHVSDPNMGGQAAALGDLDNDLDLDAIFATVGAETVWLNDGQGNFTPRPIHPSFGAGTSTALALGDLSGDGYLDVVVANTNGEPETVWVNDGTGEFLPQPNTPTFGQGDSTGVVIGDVDGNFTQDVVVANANGEPETVWVNNGFGVLTAHPITSTFGAGDSQAVRMADLDLDGDLDVVVANANNDPETAWLNDGTGIFTPHPSIPSFGEGNSLDLALGDVNGDHYFDVLVANGAGEPETVWLNDGTGGFAVSSFSFGQGDSQAVALWDADGDGDLDTGVANASGEATTVWVNEELRVLATMPAGSGGVASDVLVVTFDREVNPASIGNDTFVVNGAFTGRYTGTFAFPAANQVVFTPSIPFKAEEKLSISLTAGIRDVALNLPLRPYLWEVRGAASGGTGTFAPHPTAPQVDFGYGLGLQLGDFNGDQSLDVLTNEGIWLNDGTATFSPHPGMPNGGGEYFFDPLAGDLDGDGDLDVLNRRSEGENEFFVVWLNDGTGVFSLNNTFPAVSCFYFTPSTALTDMDGDGDLDIMSFECAEQGQTHLWLNTGNGTFIPHPADWFKYGFYGIDEIDLGDLDNDGDLDLLTEVGNQDIQLWRNDGGGVFTQEAYQVGFSTNQYDWTSLLGDVDSDTDLDIVINRQSSWYTGPFVDFPIFLNNGDARFNWSPNSPGTFDGATISLVLSDINGDGFLDILSDLFFNGFIDTNSLYVFTNDGGGVFTLLPPALMTPYAERIMGDLDGDGDVDMLGDFEDYFDPQLEAIWLNQNQ